MKRQDDFESRRAHLKGMSDEELKAYFWKLAQQVVDPLLELGYKNTSPAIERSVLLRMGFSSIEAKAIVNGCIERNLLGHGAGNVVYRLSKARSMDYIEAGKALCEGRLWDEAAAQF